MSLVNDLLIELDRQNEKARPGSAGFLDDLSPRPGARFAWLDRSKLLGFLAIVVLAASCLLAFSTIASLTRTPAIAAIVHPLPPAVSAQPIDSTLDAARTSASLPIPPVLPISAPGASENARIDRPAVMRSITLERRNGQTRVRIEAAGRLRHTIEPDLDGKRLELFFESATLDFQLSALDLFGTPIRSISTQNVGEGISLSLGFDQNLRLQSQSIETPHGTTLILDLQQADATRNARTHPQPTSAVTSVETRLASTLVDLGDSSPESRGMSASMHDDFEQVESKPLQIARSASDKIRSTRDTARRLAARDVAAARLARSEGDFDEAHRLYASAIAHSPNQRDAVLDWAMLLAETDRRDEALQLIRGARKHAARDTSLAMLHARLLEETGHIDDAIQLLERAGFSLTEAPEIHAMSAAYLQRTGRHERAIELYETIIRRYPGESRWWMGLGISLEAVDRREEALDVYRIAVQTGDLARPTRSWVTARIDALSEKG